MISVGIDVSKGKSTVCILKPYGEIVCSPFEVVHVEKELDNLDNLLKKLDGELRIVMEATGIYHLPVLTYLQEKGYFEFGGSTILLLVPRCIAIDADILEKTREGVETKVTLGEKIGKREVNKPC